MKNDRHSVVEVSCEFCGNLFSARKERVDIGLGRFCSKTCYHNHERNLASQFWGRKDLARKYKIGNRYCARWYDENGKACSTSYQRWWWEMNVGEIPKGMFVLFRDNNPMNIDPSNFILGTKKDATDKGKITAKSDPVKWISAIAKRANKVSEKWRDGSYKNVSGKNHWRWKGGGSNVYPNKFNRTLKNFIKSRDNYQCQICSRDLRNSKLARIHHRDGNKENCDQDNLILLCKFCHGKVHSKSIQSPPIMALREELL